MSVSVDLGFRRYCKKCGVAFYDLFNDPIKCPKCLYRMEASKFTQLKSSRMSMDSAGDLDDEDKDSDLEDDISEIDLEDVIDEDEDSNDVMAIAGSVEDEESGKIKLISNEATADEDI